MNIVNTGSYYAGNSNQLALSQGEPIGLVGYCQQRQTGMYQYRPDPQQWVYGNASYPATTLTFTPIKQPMTGTKFVVVCAGSFQSEHDTLDEAQTKAEQLAHQLQADAYVLRPTRKVAPKRDTVTTEL